MSPTTRTPKGAARWHSKPRYNDSTVKGSECLDQDELDAHSATTTASWPNSDDDDRRAIPQPVATQELDAGRMHGQQLLGMVLNGKGGQPPPPPPPAAGRTPLKTPLKRLKTLLQRTPLKTPLTTGASLFVPKTALAAEAAPFVPRGDVAAIPPPRPYQMLPQANTERPYQILPQASMLETQVISGKECLKDVIQASLGAKVFNIVIVDTQSFTGQWYASVEVIITAPQVGNNSDREAVASVEQTAKSIALSKLIQSLENFSPKITVMPTDDPSLLSVQYCATDPEHQCWEFANRGHCPRGQTCRWSHPVVESFLISITLQQPMRQPQVLQQPMPRPKAAYQFLVGGPTVAQESSSTLSSLPISWPGTCQPKSAQCHGDDFKSWPKEKCGQGISLFSMPTTPATTAPPTPAEVEKLPTECLQYAPGSWHPAPPPAEVKAADAPQKKKSWADIQEDSDDEEPFEWTNAPDLPPPPPPPPAGHDQYTWQ